MLDGTQVTPLQYTQYTTFPHLIFKHTCLVPMTLPIIQIAFVVTNNWNICIQHSQWQIWKSWHHYCCLYQEHSASDQHCNIDAVLLKQNKFFDGPLLAYPHQKVYIDLKLGEKLVHHQDFLSSISSANIQKELDHGPIWHHRIIRRHWVGISCFYHP